MQSSIHESDTKLIESQSELARVLQETEGQRFALKRTEQQLAVVQSLLDGVRLIHPHTVDQLEGLSFKEGEPISQSDLYKIVQKHNMTYAKAEQIEIARREMIAERQ